MRTSSSRILLKSSSRVHTISRDRHSWFSTTEDMSSMGGYEYCFIETPPDEMVCKICQYPVRDPLLSECCGQNFCKSCLEMYAESDTSYCPYCRKNDFNAFHDRRTERALLSHHVSCSWDGCSWRGELRHVEKHEECCEYVEVTCPNNCGKEIQRKHVQEHCKTTCEFRPDVCKYCHISGTSNFIHGKHLQTCNKMPVECPHHCGVGRMPQNKLEEHLELCPLQKVPCDYAGCTAKLLRKEKEHHNYISTTEHLELVSKNLQESQQKVKVLEEKYTVLEEKYTQLTELVKVAVCTHQSLPWSMRILVEYQMRNNYEYPFIVKISRIGDVKYERQPVVFSPSFYSSRNGYHMRLFLTTLPQAQSSYSQLLLGWQLLPGDHDNELRWPVHCSLRLEVLNHLNDSNHVYCTGRVNGLRRTHGHHSPPLFNIQTISGRINMDYSYITDDIMYVRILEITFGS